MHQILYLDFSTRKSEQTITKECRKIADSEGDYKGQIKYIRFYDRMMKNYEQAQGFIDLNDSGWYDNLAVKYMNGRKKQWLVKIEFHC